MPAPAVASTTVSEDAQLPQLTRASTFVASPAPIKPTGRSE
jgi:hypothetical protein